jgi:iron(III) transport system ATP-binding protein
MSGGLHINNLSHDFDDVAVVRGVSVFVAPGEVVCLLGPSGCGKTTLLRVAAGLERLQRGQVHIGENVVADAATGLHIPPEKRGIGLMFQDFALFPHLSVRDNIHFGVGADTPERRSWGEHALKLMDLDSRAENFPHMLSGGQQQRVALLRALAPKPRVLFLDEPFSGLDVTRRAQVRQQTLNILKDTGVATLMVTHDPEEAMSMADRILVMNEGRVVQDGTPVETYFEPADPFVAGFFGPINKFTGSVVDGHVITPLGSFAAPDLAEGSRADVLIRPEGLRIAEAGSKPVHNPGDAPCKPAPPLRLNDNDTPSRFEVLGARPLGGASLVRFSAPTSDADSTEIVARIPGVFLPTPGSRITVSVNANEAHVFSAE